ncbi:MAG TPA: sigma-70 family RNA polymerase sigma factor [Micromonosporaceae bacterium]
MSITPAPRPAADPSAWSVIERAQAGDADAFAELYTEHRAAIHKYIRGRLGHELADDMTQEVFVRVLKYVRTVEYNGRPPVAWLMTITRNLVIDYTRGARWRHESRSTGIDDLFDQVDPDPGPEAAAEIAALRRTVHAALARLRPSHRRVLTLRFLQGLDLYETAAAMGTTFEQTKSLQFRATRALAKLITRESVEASAA